MPNVNCMAVSRAASVTDSANLLRQLVDQIHPNIVWNLRHGSSVLEFTFSLFSNMPRHMLRLHHQRRETESM
jgi:hypothetical protein